MSAVLEEKGKNALYAVGGGGIGGLILGTPELIAAVVATSLGLMCGSLLRSGGDGQYKKIDILHIFAPGFFACLLVMLIAPVAFEHITGSPSRATEPALWASIHFVLGIIGQPSLEWLARDSFPFIKALLNRRTKTDDG